MSLRVESLGTTPRRCWCSLVGRPLLRSRMASLTPRETSTGLRRPRISGLAPAPARAKPKMAGHGSGRFAVPSIDDGERSESELSFVPATDTLRNSVRQLKERRVARLAKKKCASHAGEAADGG